MYFYIYYCIYVIICNFFSRLWVVYYFFLFVDEEVIFVWKGYILFNIKGVGKCNFILFWEEELDGDCL